MIALTEERKCKGKEADNYAIFVDGATGTSAAEIDE